MRPLIIRYELRKVQPNHRGPHHMPRMKRQTRSGTSRKKLQRFRFKMSRKSTNSISDPRDMEFDDIASLLHRLHIWALRPRR